MDPREILSENWNIKLLSLGLALILWLYVSSTGKTEVMLSVPVELRNIPAGMTVVGDVTANIEVRIQGQDRVLRDGGIGKQVFALLDLARTKEGENILRISPYDIKRPVGTTIMHLSRTEIKVKLERIVQKAFTLRPVLHGRPAAGYRLAGTTVTPQKVLIEGPASVIKTLGRLETMPIDIQKATQTITIEPKIDYQGKPVKLMEKSIAVQVRIERTEK